MYFLLQFIIPMQFFNPDFVSSILFLLNVLLCICHGMKFFLLLWQIILLDLIDYAVIVFYELKWIVLGFSGFQNFYWEIFYHYEWLPLTCVLCGGGCCFQYTFFVMCAKNSKWDMSCSCFCFLMFGVLCSFIFMGVAFLSLGKFSLTCWRFGICPRLGILIPHLCL